MPKVTKEELIQQLKDFIGDNTSDTAISLLDNLTDTVNTDYASELQTANNKIEQLTQEKNELDKSWKQKYISRFNQPIKEDELNGDTDDTDPEPYSLSYDTLFKIKE